MDFKDYIKKPYKYDNRIILLENEFQANELNGLTEELVCIDIIYGDLIENADKSDPHAMHTKKSRDSIQKKLDDLIESVTVQILDENEENK